MAPLRVLFAGDSNLKFVDQYVEKREKGHLVVLSVRGASVVGDSKGFRGRLQQHLIKFQPQVVFLHLGSNDAGSGKIYNFKSELLDLLNEIEYISPGVKVNLCLVLPRTYNHFKGILWNRRVLPRIQTDIEKVNQVVKQICLERNLEFVNYGLPVSHLGSDGLHVKPLGAKHLLSTIIGKVKNKCFAPKVKEPCSPQPSGTVERTLDAEEWPVLPKTKMDEVWEAAFNTHCRVRQVDVLRKVTTIIKGTCNKKDDVAVCKSLTRTQEHVKSTPRPARKGRRHCVQMTNERTEFNLRVSRTDIMSKKNSSDKVLKDSKADSLSCKYSSRKGSKVS